VAFRTKTPGRTIIPLVLLAGLILLRLLPLNIPHPFFDLISFAIVADCFLICVLLVLDVRSRAEPQVKNVFRLLTLCAATVSGFFFLGHVLSLLLAYNYHHHRFAPGLISPHEFADALLLGVGFLLSAFVYRMAARSRNPAPQ
jgi:hypothetical protein